MSRRERYTVGVATPGRKPTALERVGRALAAPLRHGPLGSRCRPVPRGCARPWAAPVADWNAVCRVARSSGSCPKYPRRDVEPGRGPERSGVPCDAGAVVLDVGASIGSYAMLFGQWTRPHGRVYAFEPAPDIRAALERHVRDRTISTASCVPVAAAASDANGRSPFVTPGPHGISRLAGGGRVLSAPGGDDHHR